MASQQMRYSTWRWLWLALLALGLLIALWLLASLTVAYQLTRRPEPWFAEPAPAADWGTFESHRLKTVDGQDIGAWLVTGAEDAPSVLLIHGIGASRSVCLSMPRSMPARAAAF